MAVYDGTFGWDKEKEAVLKNINMRVPYGKFTMVVGPVGCGKSTLLKALLGEVSAMEGSVYVASLEIAFCDQTPWHMNGTVQSSILGVAEFDERWYTAVIRACALDEDLRRLPRGDQTWIGSKGIALSGGQSQRIVSSTAASFSRAFCCMC
jgi:ABC-type bacteriocin/lantibiotic exporter with double-glycine peptidase domain